MAGANRIHGPRRGSLQFWPRVRATKLAPTVRTWADNPKVVKAQGFIGYKAGMTHVMIRDNRPNSNTKGEEVAMPVTVIECPPVKVIALRFYKHSTDGLFILHDTSSKKTQEPKEFDVLKLVIASQPKMTGTGTKSPEIIEVSVSGSNKEEKLKFANSLLGKDLKITDVFKEGQFLDSHGVTKGQGFQGTVKRMGVPLRHHKSEKTKRGIGTLGPWVPSHVSWKVAQPGKMGYHTRTEYNKWIMKVSSDSKQINPKGGFVRYGLVKNDYLLVKGSVQGPIKRPVVLIDAIRTQGRKPLVPEITLISLESKQ